jgi:hypothetical protein
VTSRLAFQLHAAGVLAPGLDSLAALRALRSGAAYTPAPLVLPAPAMLPANERRRASQVVRLALACIEQALAGWPQADTPLRSVFATDEGTGEVCQEMLRTLAGSRQVSPLLFPNSVQNAPSGYYSIGRRNPAPATVVTLGLESFAAGLLCAAADTVVTAQPVLLVAYDPAMTAPLHDWLPVGAPLATAWLLGPLAQHAPALAAFELELQADSAPTPWPAWLPRPWAAASSAQGLAALGLLDDAPGATHRLAYAGQGLHLRRINGAMA